MKTARLPAALTSALLAALLPGAALAGKVKTLSFSGPQAFSSGQRQGLALSSEGALRLTRPVVPHAELNAAAIWALAADHKGGCWAAVGPEGKLLKVDAAGRAEVVHVAAPEHKLLLSLALAGEALFVGCGPTGDILRVTPDGETRLWAKTGQGYVWALSYDAAADELWAATGPQGEVHRYGADGRLLERFRTRQEHVLCLARADAGTLFAGTAPQGIVYRLRSGKAPEVVHQCPQAEVRALLAVGGELFVGTSGVEPRRHAAPPIVQAKAEEGEPAARPQPLGGGEGQPVPASVQNASRRDADASPPSAPAATASAAAGRENSVYRVSADGTVRELFRVKGQINALARPDGCLLAAVGGPTAQLVEIDEAAKCLIELARLDHAHVQQIAVSPQGQAFLAASDPGRIYRLSRRYAAKGSYHSDLCDAGRPARWGMLSWRADVPEGAGLKLEVRSGAVEPPDASWSAWLPVAAEPAGAANPAPPGRYLQLRATWTSSSGAQTAELRELQVRYQQVNLAPEVTAIETPEDDKPAFEPGKKLKLKWSAADPNDDDLAFSVYCRKEGWKDWIELARALDKKEFEWDPAALPSGRYQVKVVATDRPDNSEAEAAQGERISRAFTLDRTPPAVTAKVVGLEGDRAVVEATAADGESRLASAGAAVDGQAWSAVFPADGMFDGRTKRFRFRTEPLRPGTHVLVFKATDAAGNVGSADFVFEVRQKSR